MIIKELYTVDNPEHKEFLQREARDFWGFEIVKDTILNLLDTANALSPDKCVGLTANQIGSPDPVFVMLVTRDGARNYIPIIDPKVIAVGGGRKGAWESCLSIPNEMDANCGNPPGRYVKRHKWITISFYNTYKYIWEGQYPCFTKKEPERITIKFKNFEARIVQHELNHLKGILI